MLFLIGTIEIGLGTMILKHQCYFLFSFVSRDAEENYLQGVNCKCLLLIYLYLKTNH